MTINELIESYYLEIESTLKPLSVAKMKNIVNLHILPFFNARTLPFSVDQVNSWKLWILEKGFSDTYNRAIFVCLSTILNFGFRAFDIPNIMHRCKNFKKMRKSFQAKIYTLDEFLKFSSVISNIEHKAFFSLLFYCGLRRGEALALTWDDVFTNRIVVNKTLTKGILGTPKTESSYRDVFIPEFIYELLEKLHQKSSRKFLFKLKETTIDRLNRKYSTLANLNRIRIHDFRHSHITYLMYQNFTLMAICQRSGHKDKEMVLNRYSHLLSSEQVKISNKIEQDFESFIKKNNP